MCGLGHAHPKVADAIARQAATLTHTSNLYRIPEQERLGEPAHRNLRHGERVLLQLRGGGQRGHHQDRAPLRSLTQRRYAAHRRCRRQLPRSHDGERWTATGNRKVQAGFEPLLGGFVRAPYNDVESVEKIAANNKNVVAVLVEPILGEGGIVIPDDGYLEALRDICDRHGWLLMLDEVQTGNGRTGRYFAYQHTGIVPDVVATAKGLGNGVPIGACLARGDAAKMLVAGTHGSTFGGNFLVCAAANAVVDELTDGGIIDRAAELGERMQARFRERLAGNNRVKEIRGKGLMLAVELNEPCTDLVGAAVDAGLLINVAADTVVRLLPPLNMSDDEADAMVDQVVDLIDAMPG